MLLNENQGAKSKIIDTKLIIFSWALAQQKIRGHVSFATEIYQDSNLAYNL